MSDLDIPGLRERYRPYEDEHGKKCQRLMNGPAVLELVDHIAERDAELWFERRKREAAEAENATLRAKLAEAEGVVTQLRSWATETRAAMSRAEAAEAEVARLTFARDLLNEALTSSPNLPAELKRLRELEAALEASAHEVSTAVQERLFAAMEACRAARESEPGHELFGDADPGPYPTRDEWAGLAEAEARESAAKPCLIHDPGEGPRAKKGGRP
jgi:hypothetical protein